MSSDLRAPGYPTPPFDFDSIDDRCFSEQLYEQYYIHVPIISGCQEMHSYTYSGMQSNSARTMKRKKGLLPESIQAL
jgi:hypothetical protein